jgi:hypothetical protein
MDTPETERNEIGKKIKNDLSYFCTLHASMCDIKR